MWDVVVVVRSHRCKVRFVCLLEASVITSKMVRRSSRIRDRVSESSVSDFDSDASSIISEVEPVEPRKKRKTKRLQKILPISQDKANADKNTHSLELHKIEEEEHSFHYDDITNLKPTTKISESDSIIHSRNHHKEATALKHYENKFKPTVKKHLLEYLNQKEKQSLGILGNCILKNQCSEIPFLGFLVKKHNTQNKDQKTKISDELENDVFGLHLAEVSVNNDINNLGNQNKEKQIHVSSSFSLETSSKIKLHVSSSQYAQKTSEKQVEQLMKKSVLPDDLERMEKAPKLFESYASQKKDRKKKQQETAGKGWFNMPKPELTDEVKRDLQVIQMRNALDPKRHYRKADSKKLPTFFQIGTIVEGPHEFHSARVSKKARKRTIVDELLADAEFRRKNKKRFLEIQKKNAGGGKGYYKKMKNKRKQTWART